MKNYTLTNGKWVARNPLTEEERAALRGIHEVDRKERKEFMVARKRGERPEQPKRNLTLKGETVARPVPTFSEAEGDDLALINETWEKNKPKEQEYQLIQASIHVNKGKAWGIINYRVGRNHKQIRF